MAADLNFLPRAMVDELQQGAQDLDAHYGSIRVVSHYDADGLCAAGILAAALRRRGRKYQITIEKGLTNERVEQIASEGEKFLIFSDMGSGNLDAIEDTDAHAIILDHHITPQSSEKVNQINPNLHDIEGAVEVSGSTMAFLFALALDECNWDLSPVSLSGSIGDRQHFGGFSGINKVILEESVERGHLQKKRGLVLEGEKVIDIISGALDPYFVGLSNEPRKVKAFLEGLDIDPNSKLDDLDDQMARHLTSSLFIHLMKQGGRQESIENLVDDIFYAPDWDLHAHEIANYTDACGRLGHTGNGVSMCLGDKAAIEKAKALRRQYKALLGAEMKKALATGPDQMKHIQFFYNERSEFSGSLAGLGILYFLPQDKPVLTLAVTDGMTRISSRGTRHLVSKGLDLAAACKVAAEAQGGNGGGHPVASGASVPKGKESNFLDMVDDMVGKQFKARAEKKDD